MILKDSRLQQMCNLMKLPFDAAVLCFSCLPEPFAKALSCFPNVFKKKNVSPLVASAEDSFQKYCQSCIKIYKANSVY